MKMVRLEVLDPDVGFTSVCVPPNQVVGVATDSDGDDSCWVYLSSVEDWLLVAGTQASVVQMLEKAGS